MFRPKGLWASLRHPDWKGVHVAEKTSHSDTLAFRQARRLQSELELPGDAVDEFPAGSVN